MSACDARLAPHVTEEAWERLLCLERQVRELRRMLLADESPADPHAADLDATPTLLMTHSQPGLVRSEPGHWQVTCLGQFQLWSGGRLPPSCSSRRGWAVLQYLLTRPGYAATRDALI